MRDQRQNVYKLRFVHEDLFFIKLLALRRSSL